MSATLMRKLCLLLLTLIGLNAMPTAHAQDAKVDIVAAVEKTESVKVDSESPKAPEITAAPAAPEAPKLPEAAKIEAPKIDAPAPSAPIAAPPPPPPIKMAPPKAPEMPKMDPPKVDPELAAATDRWVNLSDEQRLSILEDWKKLPEDNRIPFMIYRDDATKKVKPDAKPEAADATEKAVAAPDISVPAAAIETKEDGDKEPGTMGKLIDKIF